MIIPAILEKDKKGIEEKIDLVGKNKIGEVQIDIVDGVFGANKTFPFTDVFDGKEIDFNIRYALDLMVKDVENYIEALLKTNAETIIIHRKSTENLEEVLSKVKESGKKVFLAILPDEDISALSWVSEYIDGIQIMGIKNIGQQGEDFSQDVYSQIEKVREKFGEIVIAVDGGVNDLNMKNMKKLGVNIFFVGSFLFNGDFAKNFERLNNV